MAKGDPVHLGLNTWENTDTSTAWQGRLIVLLLKVEIDSRGVDIGIMEMQPLRMSLALTDFSSLGLMIGGCSPRILGNMSMLHR